MKKLIQMRRGRVSTGERTEVKMLTTEEVIAARQLADKAGRLCDRMAVYVAQMEGMKNYSSSELIRCKNDEERALAEASLAKTTQAALDAHAQWSAALEEQSDLWSKYCELCDKWQAGE